MNPPMIEIMGWTGTVTYLIAYGLVSAKKVEGDAWVYQGLNFFAGILLIVYTLYTKAYASTALNIVWALIAVVTLGRKVMKKNA
jgi:hypothetical protein